MVKGAWLPILLTMCISGAVKAQEANPPVLTHAVQCLGAKGFLPASESAIANFGYFLDSASYPHQNALYVVDFANASHSRGWVFTVFVSNDSDRQVLNIQNNARFVTSKEGYLGIDFPDPPLGGTWTQEHIIFAIRRIQRGTSYQIPIQEIQNARLDFQCESYADPR